MMKKLLFGLVITAAISWCVAPVNSFAAAVDVPDACKYASPEVQSSSACKDLNATKAEKEKGMSDAVKNIVNTLLYGIGIVSVIVIIVSAIRFATSGGNEESVTKARRSLIYSVAGLVIAMMAFAIVNFIIDNL
jgi:Mn2+/Fe2+ NRAMP family transporter